MCISLLQWDTIQNKTKQFKLFFPSCSQPKSSLCVPTHPCSPFASLYTTNIHPAFPVLLFFLYLSYPLLLPPHTPTHAKTSVFLFPHTLPPTLSSFWLPPHKHTNFQYSFFLSYFSCLPASSSPCNNTCCTAQQQHNNNTTWWLLLNSSTITSHHIFFFLWASKTFPY